MLPTQLWSCSHRYTEFPYSQGMLPCLSSTFNLHPQFPTVQGKPWEGDSQLTFSQRFASADWTQTQKSGVRTTRFTTDNLWPKLDSLEWAFPHSLRLLGELSTLMQANTCCSITVGSNVSAVPTPMPPQWLHSTRMRASNTLLPTLLHLALKENVRPLPSPPQASCCA